MALKVEGRPHVLGYELNGASKRERGKGLRISHPCEPRILAAL
jgi:hypothetical protein